MFPTGSIKHSFEAWQKAIEEQMDRNKQLCFPKTMSMANGSTITFVKYDGGSEPFVSATPLNHWASLYFEQPIECHQTRLLVKAEKEQDRISKITRDLCNSFR